MRQRAWRPRSPNADGSRPAAAGGAEFWAGDRRRNRLWCFGLHRDRRAGGDGAADGVGSATGRGDAQRVHRSAGRRYRGAGGAGAGAHQGGKRPGARTPLDRDDQRDHRTAQRPALVGRTWELSTITAILDEAIGGAGCVIGVLGPPGIGKSRIVRESAALAGSRGVQVFTTYCESHTSDIPFHAVTGLLRAGLGVERPRRRGRPGAGPRPILPMPTPKTCCCWMTCSASPIPTPKCPTSRPTPGGGA